MKTIWMYPVHPYFELELPNDARVLDVQVQGDKPQMWVLTDSTHKTITRKFKAVVTGDPFEASHAKYIATFQMPPFVYHLFEVTDAQPVAD